MPKNITVIAIMGLVGCLAMSMIMHYMLKTQQEHDVHPVVREVQELFGARLEGPAALKIEDRGGRRVAVLTLSPVTGLSKSRLAKDVGQYVWRRLVDEPRPQSLEVVCLDPLGGGYEVFPVPEPYVNRGRSQPAKSPAKPRR